MRYALLIYDKPGSHEGLSEEELPPPTGSTAR